MSHRNTIEGIISRCRIRKNGCWIWIGAKTHDGYGTVKFCGKVKSVHCLIYFHCRGTIKTGFELDHLCRNRACSNPEHLQPVTHKTNILRGCSPQAINAKKTHCKHGHPFSGDNLRIEGEGKHRRRRCKICASGVHFKQYWKGGRQRERVRTCPPRFLSDTR
jgi:hypothetical protein